MAQKKDEDQDFSADALSALVRPSAAPPPEPTEAEEHAGNGRAAADDDDAVLDLRALATSQAPPPPEEPAPSRAPVESKPADAKPAAEAKPAEGKAKETKSAREAPAAAAVMTRPVPEAQKSSGGMVTGLVIGALVAGAAVFFFARGDESEDASAELAAAEPQSVAASAAHEVEPTEPPVAPAEQAEVAAPAEPTEPAAEPPASDEVAAAEAESAAAERRPRAARERRAARARTTESAATTMAEEPASAEPPTRAQATASAMQEAPAQEGNNRLDSVLDDALGGRPAEGGTRTVATERPASGGAAASADLPDTPTRGDVARVLGRLLPQIRQCAADQVGLANATILVRNDGSVGSVAIAGHPFGGTPQGACMEGVIRRAQFSPFRQSTFRITYPFALRPTP